MDVPQIHRPARVLVTGAAGFVGANLARKLVNEGNEVTLLGPPVSPSWRIDDLANRACILRVDICDEQAVCDVLAQARPEHVYHLAAYGAYSDQNRLDLAMQTNVIALGGLLKACEEQGVVAFVNTGSSSEYGFCDHAPHEDEIVRPNSHYAVSKAAATQLCQHFAQSSKMRVSTLRLYSVYGPYEEPKRLIPTVLVHAMEGHLPPLVAPTICRDFVFVDDACTAFISAANSTNHEPGAIYNIGSGKETTLLELVATIQDLFDLEVEPKFGTMPDRAWDAKTWRSDSDKARRRLNWHPTYDLRAGLKTTYDWLKATPHFDRFIKGINRS